MVVKWIFTDLTDSTSYTFEINPSEGGTPLYSRNVTSQSTVAANGKTILFEGADTAPELTFTGTILSQAQYNAMITWFGKEHQIQLTDDLSRTMMIFITKFEAKRVRAYHYPYMHSYTVTAIIVNWS